MSRETIVAKLAYINMNKNIYYGTLEALLIGTLAACHVNGEVSPTLSAEPSGGSNPNKQEHTPTPELNLYPTTFAWMDSRNETVQKVAKEYGISINDIKGFQITVSGLLSATGVHEEKVQFINFIDPTTGINISAYYDSKNPNGLLNDFETINRGGGLFVERQLADPANPDNHHTLLIIPVDAEEKLKSGKNTTIEFNPPEWIRKYMPALDPNKNLMINVPVIPEFTTTASIGFIPEFLVTDGTVEGVQAPTPIESSEPALPAEVQELQKRLGADYILQKSENGDYYTIDGDETIKLMKDGSATIEYAGQTLTILQKDILNRGLDENGNKLIWARGFSRTQNSDTKELSFGLAIVPMFELGSIPKDVAPHFNLATTEEMRDKLTETDKFWARQVYEALGGDEMFKNVKVPTDYVVKKDISGSLNYLVPRINGRFYKQAEVRSGALPIKHLDVSYYIPLENGQGLAGYITTLMDVDKSIRLARVVIDAENVTDSAWFLSLNPSSDITFGIPVISFDGSLPTTIDAEHKFLTEQNYTQGAIDYFSDYFNNYYTQKLPDNIESFFHGYIMIYY